MSILTIWTWNATKTDGHGFAGVKSNSKLQILEFNFHCMNVYDNYLDYIWLQEILKTDTIEKYRQGLKGFCTNINT